MNSSLLRDLRYALGTRKENPCFSAAPGGYMPLCKLRALTL